MLDAAAHRSDLLIGDGFTSDRNARLPAIASSV
jgi:hypothetical protein